MQGWSRRLSLRRGESSDLGGLDELHMDEACEEKAVARIAWVRVREDETCNNEARENETGPAAGYPPGQGLDSDCVFNGLCQMTCARCQTCCVRRAVSDVLCV